MIYLYDTPGYLPGFRDELAIRELGGWPTADGRVVRHGLFFRGAALCGLTAQEEQRVRDFGIRAILDLRAKGEVLGQEDFVPEGCAYQNIGGMYDDQGEVIDFSPAGIQRLAEKFTKKADTFMEELYASMMFGNPAVHELVGWLVEGRVPLLFHCTAGKDRTGVCAAVLLMILGVKDEDIVQEFLLTNIYRDAIIHMRSDIPHWAKMNSVDQKDLRAAFTAVDERYATRESYFEHEFGITPSMLVDLRNRYTIA